MGISMEFLKKTKYKTNKTYMISQSHFWVYIQRKRGHYVEEISKHMFIVALFTIVEIRK